MKISILTVFSDLYKPFLQTSLIHRAQQAGKIAFDVDEFFSFVAPKERIDAPTFGHGAGMLIRPEVVERAITSKEEKYWKAYKVFFSPQGKKLDQPLLAHMAKRAQEAGHMMLLPARYEGMDARVEDQYADEIVSVGDFVLMGGDIPAMMLLEGMLRLIPGIVGKEESVQADSFTGPFVDYPEFTEPVSWQGIEVPEIVRSGNHEAIRQWRADQAAKKTVLHHFSWLRSHEVSPEQKQRAAKYIPPHYVVLMHGEVIVGDGHQVGATSVTSIDIHDIARSSATYGIKNFFVTTPLADQQRIVEKLLTFWNTQVGINYNPQRHRALRRVRLTSTIDEVIAAIEAAEGQKPLLLSTSARPMEHQKVISFDDQERVWEAGRPILFLLGTGQGMSQDLVSRTDFLLKPLHGFTDFNHLSVRSAAAIIFDRWLGINEKGG